MQHRKTIYTTSFVKHQGTKRLKICYLTLIYCFIHYKINPFIFVR